MGLGLGIMLLVVGGVIGFAIDPNLTTVVDLPTIGYILIGAGVLSIVLGLVMNQQRANTSHREIVDRGVRDRGYDNRGYDNRG